MLVENGHAEFVSKFPTSLVVRITLMGTGTSRTHDDNLRMSLHHAFIYIFKALDELRRDLLLVTDTEILQVEGLGMTSVCTHLRPLVSSRITIRPLDEVDGLSHPLIHFRHRHYVLSLSGP